MSFLSTQNMGVGLKITPMIASVLTRMGKSPAAIVFQLDSASENTESGP
jgi:hypothetical protein